MTWTDFVHNAVVRGAATGALGAAWVDFAAFRKWSSFEDALHYQWGLAIWRWFQGAVIGAVTAAGWSTLIS